MKKTSKHLVKEQLSYQNTRKRLNVGSVGWGAPYCPASEWHRKRLYVVPHWWHVTFSLRKRVSEESDPRLASLRYVTAVCRPYRDINVLVRAYWDGAAWRKCAGRDESKVASAAGGCTYRFGSRRRAKEPRTPATGQGWMLPRLAS